MKRQPIAALHVADLAASTAFYTERLGFALGEQRPDEDIAEVYNPNDPDGRSFLLAGPQTADLTPHLSGPRMVLKPGQMIRFLREDLETLRATLSERGLADLALVDGPWERTLTLADPDGYLLSFATLK